MELRQIVGFITILVFGSWVFYKKFLEPSINYKDPNRVLAEIKLLLAYGKIKKARKLIKRAIAVNPDHQGLISKYHELQKNSK